MKDPKYINFKLIPKINNLSLFLRSQDYYLFNLLKKKGRQKSAGQHIINFNKNNNENLPSIKIKKVIKIKGNNGAYSFKKIDYNYENKENDKALEKQSNNSFIPYKRKTLTRYNSCRLYNKDKKLLNKYTFMKEVYNPLVITHINKININKGNLIKFKRNYSCKIVQKKENKGINKYSVNKNKIDYNMTIYKKNEGTQMNESYKTKGNNIFFIEKKVNNNKIDYLSPKSIIFQRKIISDQIN